MINENRKVIFYAPVGNLIKGFKNGGAEAGCRKTIEVLQKAGYEVILVEKPVRKSSSKVDGFLFIFDLIKIWLNLVFIFSKNRNSVFHIAGFYLNQIYFEWLILHTARFMNLKTIYEIRNGGMIETYESGSILYQYFTKSTLVNAICVLCQGYEYVVFLEKAFNKRSVYYPNYIMDDFIGTNNTDRLSDKTLRLNYFGRVVPDKNVDFLISVCRELKLLDVPYTLDIIGGYEDYYYQQLTQAIQDYKIEADRIVFHGRMNFKDLYKFLIKSHFFVFPSKEKREGHSNSLTEAMGCGVVPIVSEAGFNVSIVDDSLLVIKEYDAQLYAKTIKDIWITNQWESLSHFVYDRVINNYRESVVKKSLLAAYDSL